MTIETALEILRRCDNKSSAVVSGEACDIICATIDSINSQEKAYLRARNDADVKAYELKSELSALRTFVLRQCVSVENVSISVPTVSGVVCLPNGSRKTVCATVDTGCKTGDATIALIRKFFSESVE